MTNDTHTNHKHEPAEAIAALHHTCKHCGVEIKPVRCQICDGFAYIALGVECWPCNATGIERWVEVKP